MTDPVATALEQHAHSLRELARALVGPTHADDVVQATAEAVLGRGPVRHPLAFLRHVLRIQAHRHHRGTARRKQRESAHAAARDTTSPPAEHALEQREAVAQLHEALMLVPQPHLGVLLLRYFEDLSPPAIAERLAAPLPTIKSRLQRGLELLRAELDRRAPRDQWQPRLATAFAVPQATLVRTGAAALFAIFTMKLVAAVSFVGLAATAWFVWPRDDVSPTSAQTAANDAPPAKAAQVATRPAAPPTERTAVAVSPTAAVVRLVGRVASSDGSPLAGATITVVPPVAGDPPSVARATADGDGAFACEPPPGEYVVRIAAPQHVGLQSEKRAFAAPTDIGTIALRHGVAVGGRVVDRDGNAIVGTLIGTGTMGQQASAPAGWFWWRGAVPRTDADGRFTIGPMLPADYAVTTPQEQLLALVLLQLAEGQADVELELRVESASRQATLRGHVVDEGGRGIAGATVKATERVDLDEFRFLATSGDDGAFSIRRLLTSEPKPVPLRAMAPGYDDTVVDDRIDWGRSDLTIVLRPLAALTLRVVDGDGTPVTKYTVRIGPLKPAGPGVAWHTGPFAVAAADTGANGEHTIRDLKRGLYDVHVTPADERLAASGVARIEVTGALQHQTMVLQPRVRRVAHLCAPDGTPVAGAKVELCEPCLGAIDLRSYVVALDRWTSVSTPEKSLQLQTDTSDAAGELTLEGPPATALVLRIPGPGCVPFVVPIPRLDGDGPLVVECKRGGTLRVHAQPLDVLAALDALRNVQREEPRPHVWLQREVGKTRERVPSSGDDTRTFDANGVATVDGVPDGTWVPRIAAGRELILLPATAIAEGTNSDVTVDLAPLRPVTLRGRVVADSPVAGRNVNVERQRGAVEANPGRWDTVGGTGIMLDEAGAFVLHTLPGRFRVLLLKRRTDDYGTELLAQPAGVDVAPGGTCEQTFTVATGSVLLRFVDREQRPVAGVLGAQLYRADGMFLANMPPSDDSGRARVDCIETGRNKLVVLPRRFGAAKTAIGKLYADHPNEPDIVERTLLDLGPIVVATGDPIEQTIVLPDAWFR